MAGGVGSRFWPASTSKRPKQFLDILGTGNTMLRQTFERFAKIIPPSNILVVTNDEYTALVKEQIPEIPEANILSEPLMRNTAPCIAYAAFKIVQQHPRATMFITPADHLILKEDVFLKLAMQAIDFASTHEALITIGIEPTRPDTGYGYIEYDPNGNDPHKVLQFREKPDIEAAKKFLAIGNFSWNSGMFVWRADTILNAFKELLPGIYHAFEESKDCLTGEEESACIEKIYTNLNEVSIDYGIMEKAENTFVFNADIGWSDLGTWGSVQEHLNADDKGNVILSENVILENASGNMVKLSGNTLLAGYGLHNLIIIESNGILLIVPKKEEQKIKQLRLAAGKKFGSDII